MLTCDNIPLFFLMFRNTFRWPRNVLRALFVMKLLVLL